MEPLSRNEFHRHSGFGSPGTQQQTRSCFFALERFSRRDIQSSITRTFLMILEFFFCVLVSMFFFPSCSFLYFVNFHFRHILKCILQFPSVPKTNKKSFQQQLKSVSELNWTNCFFRFKVRLSQSKN